MDYFLSDEHTMIRDLARKIADEKIMPVRAKMDEEDIFPHDILRELAKVDLFRVLVPPEYGGFETGTLGICIAVEELARGCAGVSTTYGVVGLGSVPLIIAGSEEQKQKYLPTVAEGNLITAFSLTEPEAGSDVSNLRTNAVKDGNDWILNGRKCFITNAPEARLYTVIAQTNKERGTRGMSAFLLEKGTPGFSFGKREMKMGIRSSCTSELVFEDCRVPAENMLGTEGQGFIIAMKTLDNSRVEIGAIALGIAQGALETAWEYAAQREQFGQPIINFQAINFMLADMATQVEAARSLVYSVARFVDSNPRFFSKESAMAKMYASDVAMKVTIDAVQVMGGYGYMRDYPAEKMMRDAKITQIYEGTNQIQRLVIATNMIRELKSKTGK
jgi:alkylation response protein AidB-like acyl-CoA dehydrogenase